jgi:hypothetical protein
MNKLTPIILIFLAGCSSMAGKDYVLSEKARSVTIVDYIPPKERKSLEEFNMVRCDLTRGIGSLDQNIGFCQTKMRNDAAKLGASVVLLEPEKQKYGNAAFRTFDNTSQCNSCVSMRGLVYKKKVKQ